MLQLKLLSGYDIQGMNALEPMVSMAVTALRQRLKKPEADLDQEELGACEYTAACLAFYQLTCREGARDLPLTNESGRAVSDGDLTRRRDCAKWLLDSAMAVMGDLIRDRDFVLMLT